MADFCKQCSNQILGVDISDLVFSDLKYGQYIPALCEGCGSILVNNKGECISKTCSHHVPADKDVSYYTNTENFDFKDIKHREVGYGEWSHTIEKQNLLIDNIDQINANPGDRIYLCHEGTYSLHLIGE